MKKSAKNKSVENRASLATVFLLGCLLVCGWTVVALGQTTSATLSGIVTDETGAVIGGAELVISAPSTGFSQQAATDADGVYTFQVLPPGTYSVTARRDGFSPVEISNVVLSIGDKQSLPIQMRVGQVGETVTVQADAGQLQIKSESGERSDIITDRQIKDLALNGRNILDLVKVVPGVVSNVNGQVSSQDGLGAFNVNGTRGNQKELTIDGSSAVGTGGNANTHVTINPDAISEVRVLTSNFQAEYGKAGGAFVQLVTKSGTSEFHGTGRYFRRHDSLNANTFFNNARGLPRQLYRYDYYGYDIGGPVYLPRFGSGGKPFFSGKNRLFFFFSQEYYRQLIPNAAVNIRVPTAAERNGDFSNTTDGNGNRIFIRDPNLTGACTAANQAGCFAGNVIPRARFYANGPDILNIYPQPNVPANVGGAVYNYTSQVSLEYPRREDILRVDYNISDRTRLSGRFIHNTDDRRQPYGGLFSETNFPLTNFLTPRPGINASFTLVHTLSPTVTNEFIFGPSRIFPTVNPEDGRASRAANNITVPLLFPAANSGDIIPNFLYGGIANQTFPSTNFLGVPFANRNISLNFIDNLTKVAGRHTIKTGFFIQRAHHPTTGSGPIHGNINFSSDANNPLNTGHPYANALLGIYNSYQQANARSSGSFYYTNVEGYVQDTWKATPRLTLDYGLRVSYYQPLYDEGLNWNVFNPELYRTSAAVRLYAPILVGAARRAIDPANRPAVPTAANTLPAVFIGQTVPGSGDASNGIISAGRGDYPRGGFDSRGAQWGPRFGFAYDLSGRGNTVIRGGFGISYDRLQVNLTGDTLSRNPPLINTPNLFYGNLRDISSSTNAGVSAPPNITGFAKDGFVPTIYSYSISVQRDVGFNTVVDLAYVGTLSRHLAQARNLNSIPYGATFTRQAQDPSRYAGGVVPNVEPNLPAAYSRAGLNFSGANALPVDLLRPYPGYGTITYVEFVGSSNYHSMQVSANRRFANNLTFGLAYTWSKAMDTANGDLELTNTFNTRAFDYRLATFDRTHVFVLNYVYDLPKISRFVGDNVFARGVLDDWQISGITTLSSGTPLELGVSIAGINSGQRITGSYTEVPRFNLSANPDASGAGRGNSQINPAAFVIPAIGSQGLGSRLYLRNPSFNNHDISVFKNFPLGGEGRRYLQLRFEMFNAFNHTQFTGINSGVNLTTAAGATGGAVFADYNNLSITNNLRPTDSSDPRSRAPLGQYFGEFNATRDPRIIQLGIKMYF